MENSDFNALLFCNQLQKSIKTSSLSPTKITTRQITLSNAALLESRQNQKRQRSQSRTTLSGSSML
jgi:hypothetical protein